MDYKDKLRLAKEALDSGSYDKETIEYIFPELAESEDEKIRNFLIDFIKECGWTEKKDQGWPLREECIDWLEKQGEQNIAEISNVCEFRIETWVKIVDYVLTEHNGIGNYLIDPEVKDTAEKLQKKYKFDAASEEWDRVYRKGLDAGVNKGRAEALREQKPADKIQLGKKYKCIASPRYTAFMKGSIYEPKDKFLCSLMNFCSDCFEPIEDGEQKPAEEYNITGIGSKNAQGKLGEMIKNLKSTDKVEPKFKISDWIIRSAENFEHNKYLITEIRDCYVCEDLKDRRVTFTFNDVHKNFKLWDISDAKDGDVLVASDGSIFIFKGMIDCACKHYVALTTDGAFKFNEELEHYWETSTAVHPATKEQRDLLFQKMHEAGYEWDAEKKELKKIEQKSAWSEEDKMMLQYAIEHFERQKRNCIEGGGRKKAMQEFIDWLKSLKDKVQPQSQPQWKPSDEQMELLREVQQALLGKNCHNRFVNFMYELKRLRGE